MFKFFMDVYIPLTIVVYTTLGHVIVQPMFTIL